MRNDKGQSPLDLALEDMYNDDDYMYMDIALYLINHGCGADEDKDKLLCEACWRGKLDVVKELVEEHDRDPKGECCVLTMHRTGFDYNSLVYYKIVSLQLHHNN